VENSWKMEKSKKRSNIGFTSQRKKMWKVSKKKGRKRGPVGSCKDEPGTKADPLGVRGNLSDSQGLDERQALELELRPKADLSARGFHI